MTRKLSAFRSAIGWFALIHRPGGLERLTFGQENRLQALAALGPEAEGLEQADWPELTQRLRDYADGRPVDFQDVPVALDGASPFRSDVVGRCRQIPAGRVWTYGQLAAAVGRPRAARAVGRVMATNPVPIVVPCHRVVGCGGEMVGYSGCGGLITKRRLLELEGHLHKLG